MATSYRRRMGDRKDGRLLRSLSAFSKFIPYIMPTRNDATNYYEESFDVSAVDRRLRQLRVEGYKGIGILHFLIAAYIRLVSMLPGLNRFVVGRRIYARHGICVVMVVKRTRYDKRLLPRLFTFQQVNGHVRPLWLGSQLGGILEDFRFVDGQVMSLQSTTDGRYVVMTHKWRKFGLGADQILIQGVDKETALKVFLEK